MSSMKMSEDFELPINLEDLPNFKLKITETDSSSEQLDELTTAKNFMKDLQSFLSNKRKDPSLKDDLLNLYDYSFNKISTTVFKSSPWPSPEDIEASDETLELDITTQLLYQELCYRHIFARLPSAQNEVRVKAWENYIEIFRTVEKEDIPLPVLWIWDIMDEFIYQFQTSCVWRAKIKGDEPLYQELIATSHGDFWNLEKINEILKDLISKSQILKKEKNGFSLEDFGNNTKSIHYFGYFSLVSLLRLNILIGKHEEALQIIEIIDYKKLGIYSKAYACYISMFYYVGFAYLMTGRYQEAVKIFEILLSFIYKYKQFYSKSFQAESMNKQADKTLFLLALALVFFPTNIEETIMNHLKERLGDKLEKLNKYDYNTFSDTFGYGCPKFVNPIKNMNDFRNMDFDKNIAEPLNFQKEVLYERYLKIQNINNISSILKLYSRIPVSKAAKLLNVQPNNLKELLELYKKRNEIIIKDTPFDKSIIQKFLKGKSQIEFKIENEMIIINEISQNHDYSNVFLRQLQKIDEIVKELDFFNII